MDKFFSIFSALLLILCTASAGQESEKHGHPDNRCIDVLVVFHHSAEEYAQQKIPGSDTPRGSDLGKHLGQANEVLDNSGLEDFSIKLVKVDKARFEAAKDALGEKSEIKLQGFNEQAGYVILANTGGGTSVEHVRAENADPYQTLMEKFGADICVIFVHAPQNDSSQGHLAGVARVRERIVIIDISSALENYTLIHEVGHLAGCGHSAKCKEDGCTISNSEEDQSSPAHGVHGTKDGAKYRTIMSYKTCGGQDYKLTHKPSFSRNGSDYIIIDGRQVDVPLDRPEGCDSAQKRYNNAHVFRQGAEALAEQNGRANRPPNDSFDNAQLITDDDVTKEDNGSVSYLLNGTTHAASGEPDGSPCQDGSNQTVWYKFVVPQDGAVCCGISSPVPSAARLMVGQDRTKLSEARCEASDKKEFSSLTEPARVKAGDIVYICVDNIRDGNVKASGDFCLALQFIPRDTLPGLTMSNTLLLILTLVTAAAAIILIIRSRKAKKAPRPAGHGRIIIFHPDGREETHPFHTDTVTIGRSADNDIVIRDPSVSGHHAILRWQNGKMEIKDLGSANGIVFLADNTTLTRDEASTITTEDTVALGRIHLSIDQKP